MNLKYIFSVVIALLLLVSCGKVKPPVYEVANPFNEAVIGKAIVLDRALVEPLIQGDFTDESLVQVTDRRGRILISQLDDINGDGKWDELAFLASFGVAELQQFSFTALSADEFEGFPIRTNVRFAYKNPPHGDASNDLRLKSTDSPTISAIYQMEGPGWENDIVGFRNYYDARNGMDIFGKRTSDMVLDYAGIDGQDYHVLDDWGMDILKVANSLGAGAIALGIGDEIYRIGLADEAGFRLIAEGPVRSVLEFYFNGIAAGNRNYNVVHRISIYAGDHFYRSKVWVEGLIGDEVLYSGVVDLHDLEPFELSSAGYTIIGTHGNQGFDDEILGLGIIIPDEQFLHLKAAPKSGDGVTFTHLTGIKLSFDAPSEYAFFAGWELQDPGFATEFYFKDLLTKAALKLDGRLW